MHRSDLRTVAELKYGRNQADRECREQLVDVVHLRIGDVADEEPEVERCREQHEEAEDDLLEIHGPPSRPDLYAELVEACPSTGAYRCLVADVRGDQTVSCRAGDCFRSACGIDGQSGLGEKPMSAVSFQRAR